MAMNWRRAAAIAVAVFLALFAFRFWAGGPSVSGNFPTFNDAAQSISEFEIGRKNYATSKKLFGEGAAVSIAPAGAETQKYEKIGNLTQSTTDYEADRMKIDELVTGNKGIVQFERAIGLAGSRTLQLGIGVPPANFEQFIEAARSIGSAVAIEIIKNDKTTEYLQLRAKRDTLAKARAALEELKAGGGAIDERVNVQTRLTEIEQQIQDLGVSLGEFDSENELCTVKLSLREAVKPRPVSMKRRLLNAFESAVFDYAMLGLGFFGLVGGAWIGLAALQMLRAALRLSSPPPGTPNT